MRYIRSSKNILIHITLLLVLATAARAQGNEPGLAFGIGGGYQSTTSGSFAFPASITCSCEVNEQGEITGGSAHIDLTIPKLLPLSNLTTIARLRVTTLQGSSRTPTIPVRVLLGGVPMPVDQVVEYSRSFSIIAAHLDLLGEYRLPWNFIIRGGASTGYRSITRMRFIGDLIKPENARFLNPDSLPVMNNGRRIIFYDSSWPEQRKLSYGLSAQLGYEVGIVDGVSIIPEAGARYEFNTPASGFEWPQLELTAGIALRLKLGEASWVETPILPPGTSDAATPPRMTIPPSTSIDLFSVDPNGTRMQNAVVRTRTTIHTRTILLPSAILFEHGSASIPARHISPPGRSISTDSLARLAPHEAHGRLLDLIGSQLANSRHATARIIGSIADGEPSRLARTRAERVRAYLIDRWRCSPSQLTIASAREQSATGSVRIEVPSLPQATTIATEWRERRIDASPIEIEPDVKGIAVRRWSIEILRNEKLLARQRSYEPEKDLLTLDMLLREMSAGDSPAPLAARFVVEDSAGRSFSASDELPFVVDSSGAAIPDSSIATYVLVHDEESRHIERAIRDIASAINGDARVVVAPLRASAASSTMAQEAVARIRELDRRGSVTMDEARYEESGGSDWIEISVRRRVR